MACSLARPVAAVLPNTTSDDAANAAIIVNQSYEADWCSNGAAVSTGPADNLFRVIVDVQPYRLSRLVQRRHNRPCLAISLANTEIPRFEYQVSNSRPFFLRDVFVLLSNVESKLCL